MLSCSSATGGRSSLYQFGTNAEHCALSKDGSHVGTAHTEQVYRHYNSPAIAAGYGKRKYITPCERLLFNTYIEPGVTILDMGVGGRRTSQYLAETASRYVSIDYAPEMVRICREKYPEWEYMEIPATDPSPFQSESFDVVVLSLQHA